MTSHHRIHTYRTALAWEGTTAVGYDRYERDHIVSADPAEAELALSADPSFRGDPIRLNPEQLLVAAASSCQLLSFLAVAARARLDVVSYRDEVEAVMAEDDPPIRISRIDLRPVVVLVDTDTPRPPDDRLHHLTDVAHRACFIANSLTSDVVVSPTFIWRGDPASGETRTAIES